jgi:hypothetical protein
MTSYEHAMLGVTGTLAAGLHRRYGWEIVALGGLAAILPDWDGWSLAFGAAAFDRVHRTAGHNVFACSLLAAAVAALDCRYRLIGRLRRLLGRWIRPLRAEEESGRQRTFRPGKLCVGDHRGACFLEPSGRRLGLLRARATGRLGAEALLAVFRPRLGVPHGFLG